MNSEQAPTEANACPRCHVGEWETFFYMNGHYVFDVDKAREIVKDGRETFELDPADVRFSVETSEIDERHLPHVNMSIPGIMGHVWLPVADGEVWHGHVLIDGNHRAARALKEGIPFEIFVLSEEESRSVLLRSPETIAAQAADQTTSTAC